MDFLCVQFQFTTKQILQFFYHPVLSPHTLLHYQQQSIFDKESSFFPFLPLLLEIGAAQIYLPVLKASLNSFYIFNISSEIFFLLHFLFLTMVANLSNRCSTISL